MKNNAMAICWSAVITIGSLLISLIKYCSGGCREVDFTISVCLALFGSGFVALLLSIVGYRDEKIRTLEGFSKSSHKLIREINKYTVNGNTNEKAEFYLKYNEIDKSEWDGNFARIFFLCDCRTKHLNYIYDKIYQPIQSFNEAISLREIHFRKYISGETDNEVVIAEYIKEIEELFIIRESQLVGETKMTTIYNKIVKSLLEELNGRYYEIMYGKNANRGKGNK